MLLDMVNLEDHLTKADKKGVKQLRGLLQMDN
jgi:hypothetical protein